MSDKDPRKALGEFIRKTREDAGIEEQKTFAEQLGVSAAYVSKLESGDATPSPELLLDLVRVFGADSKEARKLLLAVNNHDANERWARAATRLGVDLS